MGVRSVDFKERGIEGCLGRGTTGTTDNVITSVNGEMRAIAERSGDHHFILRGILDGYSECTCQKILRLMERME